MTLDEVLAEYDARLATTRQSLFDGLIDVEDVVSLFSAYTSQAASDLQSLGHL